MAVLDEIDSGALLKWCFADLAGTWAGDSPTVESTYCMQLFYAIVKLCAQEHCHITMCAQAHGGRATWNVSHLC